MRSGKKGSLLAKKVSTTSSGESMSMLLTEIRRKGVHLLDGLLLAFLYWMGWINQWFFIVLFTLCVAAVLTYRSAIRRKRTTFIAGFFNLFERKKHRNYKEAGKSALQYHLALVLAVLLFPKDAAIASMIILAVGDTVALWYGVFFGKVPCPWNKKKDLDARLFAALLCTLLLLPVLPWWHALIASGAAMIAESFDLKIGSLHIDDNFLIPLVAGIIIILL